MTDDLIYSMDAVNTLSQFTETDYVVFVEDKDDEFFGKKSSVYLLKRKVSVSDMKMMFEGVGF